MKLSILIVSYNAYYHLVQCLHSVFSSQVEAELEVIVVDNASRDGTPQRLAQTFPVAQYPQLQVIANTRNIGFGRANNRALRHATGNYVLYLNPDTLLTSHTLRDALVYAEAHPRLGAMGVKMLGIDGRFAPESRRGLPTPWTAFCKLTGLSRLFPHSSTFGRYYMQAEGEDEASRIEVVSGAFMLLPAEQARAMGGFDEQFFMYGEDIDLSFRLLQAGRENHYLPTPIIHYKGASTQRSTFRYVHVFYGAMLLFFRKHYPHFSLFLSLPIKLGILLRALVALSALHLRRLWHFLLPRLQFETTTALFLGEENADVLRIGEESGLQIDFRAALSEESNELPEEAFAGKYDYLIFDISAHSYDQIIATLQSAPQRFSAGIYSPRSKAIILGDDVFC